MRDARPLSPFPLGLLAGFVLVGLLAVPFLVLALSSSPDEFLAGIGSPVFAPALALSLSTTVVSVIVIVIAGTPIAWWLAVSQARIATTVGVLVQLPIVMPPAVVGVALLETFGRRGVFGPALDAIGVTVPFTSAAVVIAQVVVAAPFFIQAAANAFREVDPEALRVARTLGAKPRTAWLRVALPMALPGLVVGASLAWARALGEFGATLLFAGNLTGRTQTLPLAILSALEADVDLAVVLSLVLVALGGLLLGALHAAPRLLGPTREVRR